MAMSGYAIDQLGVKLIIRPIHCLRICLFSDWGEHVPGVLSGSVLRTNAQALSQVRIVDQAQHRLRQRPRILRRHKPATDPVLQIFGCLPHPTGDLQRSRDLLASGMLDAAALITHRAPVARFEEAYATALNDPECLKLVIEWNVGG